MLRLLCTATFVVFSSTAALAQELDVAAAPSSIAITMIENARAEGIFEVVDDGHITVRHLGSGMICRFQRDHADRLLLLFPGRPPGDDVGCFMRGTGRQEQWTFYATRYPTPTSLSYHIKDHFVALRQRREFPRRLSASPVALEGQPEIRAQNYLLTLGRHKWFTSEIVSQVGGWTIQLRYSQPTSTSDMIAERENTAALLFTSMLREMAQPRP